MQREAIQWQQGTQEPIHIPPHFGSTEGGVMMEFSMKHLKNDEVDFVFDQNFCVLSDFPLHQCFVLFLQVRTILSPFNTYHYQNKSFSVRKRLRDFLHLPSTSHIVILHYLVDHDYCMREM